MVVGLHRGQMFEAESEIKFSVVLTHDLLLLRRDGRARGRKGSRPLSAFLATRNPGGGAAPAGERVSDSASDSDA